MNLSMSEVVGECFHPENFQGKVPEVMNDMFKLEDAVIRVKRQEDVTEDSSETVVAPDILRQDVPPGVRMMSLHCLQSFLFGSHEIL